jgi:hypothetical protein
MIVLLYMSNKLFTCLINTLYHNLMYDNIKFKHFMLNHNLSYMLNHRSILVKHIVAVKI